MGFGNGIGIGWPNASYQSGGPIPFSAEIPADPMFDIPTGQNYTIEFYAGYITPKATSEPHVFFSFGADIQGEHAAFLTRNGANWEFLYSTNSYLIFIWDVSTAINTNFWNYFVIERKGNNVYLGVNGTWVTSTPVSSPSPAIPTGGNQMNIGSNGQEFILNGMMNNFRWSTTDVYDVFSPFFPPQMNLMASPPTIMLTMQGGNLASSLIDQSGNGNDIIAGTNVSYVNTQPYAGMSGSLLFQL